MAADKVVDFPVVQDVQISLSWFSGRFPWSRLFVGPQSSSVLLDKVVNALLFETCRFLRCRRGGDSGSHSCSSVRKSLRS